MASSRGIRAGKAFVELFADDSHLVRGLRSAQRKLRSFGVSITSMGMRLAGVGATIAGSFIPAITAASRKQETLNKFAAVFGEHYEVANKFAEELAVTIGRSATEVKDSMAAFQGFFTGLGAGGGQALSLSQRMQQLALDFASFHNLSDDEAMQRFISALSGSSEVLDKFGVNIKAAALDEKLQSMFGVGMSQATEFQKVMARMAIIEEVMGKQGAIGDAEKTAGSFANQLKRLRAGIIEFGEAVGGAVLPVLTKIISVFNGVLPSVISFVKQNAGAVVSVLAVAAALTTAGASAIVFGVALSGIAVIVGAIATVTSFLLSNVGMLVAGVAALTMWAITSTEALRYLADFFKPLADRVQSTLAVIVDAIRNGNVAGAVAVLWAAIRLEWEKGHLWLLESSRDLVKGVLSAFNVLGRELVNLFTYLSGTIAKTMLSMFGDLMRSSARAAAEIASMAGKDDLAKKILKKGYKAAHDIDTVAGIVDSNMDSSFESNQKSFEKREKKIEKTVGKGFGGAVDKQQKRVKDAESDLQKAIENVSEATEAGDATGLPGQFQLPDLQSLIDQMGGGVGAGSRVSGTFSSMSDRIFGGDQSQVSQGEKLIVGKLDNIYKALEDWGVLA